MRLPSLQHLAGEARRSVARFPFVIFATVVAAAGGLIAVDAAERDTFVKILVCAQLGIPMFFAVAVAGETGGWPLAARRGLSLFGALLLVAYYFTLPDWMRPGAVTRFVQFNVGLHLLVAFGPFAGPGRTNGFWQYNKSLFLRFLTAVLYSVVVFVGLSIALLAIDKLLGLSVDDDWYLRLWIVIAFVFNTWVFVGGVPSDVAGLDRATDYPRGLKVFSQYILIPLVVVYLAILTIYLFKVVITAQWPSGWIGYLVSSVAVAGILALLLVWPVSKREENKWVGTYTRWFFIFMIPAIVMLLLAIYKRIDQYGITENRYFLAVLALWLAAIAVYFIASPKKSIKLIPATLCAVAFATSFGPWGAYSVARHSQTARLQAILEKNGVLVAGAIQNAAGEVPFDDRKEISAITSYLVDHHGTEAFEPWFGEERLADVDTLDDGSDRYNDDRARLILGAMGIEYVERWTAAMGKEGYFSLSIDGEQAVFPVAGADYLVRLSPRATPLGLDQVGDYTVTWSDTTGVVLRDSAGVVLALPMEPLFERVESLQREKPGTDPARLPRDVLRLVAENDRARLDAYFTTLSGTAHDGGHRVSHFEAGCFVTIKP